MILKYESDIMDDENARGKFYHVCQGRVQETPIAVPPEDQPFECPVCEVDLGTGRFYVGPTAWVVLMGLHGLSLFTGGVWLP